MALWIGITAEMNPNLKWLRFRQSQRGGRLQLIQRDANLSSIQTQSILCHPKGDNAPKAAPHLSLDGSHNPEIREGDSHTKDLKPAKLLLRQGENHYLGIEVSSCVWIHNMADHMAWKMKKPVPQLYPVP